MSQPDDAPLAGLRLDQISTHVATLQDAERFVLRYGKSVQAYLLAILRDPQDAADTWQDLLVSLLRRGGPGTWPGRGRFRDYLKVSARNAAITSLRRKRKVVLADQLECHPDTAAMSAAEQKLASEWQRCLLDKVWNELELHERQSPGNLFYTSLRVYTEFHGEDSPRQAAIVSERVGRPLAPDAYRKQVSRAKRQMAELILVEVSRTVAVPTADEVEAELSELGLMRFVRDYLPDDWRTRFFESAG